MKMCIRDRFKALTDGQEVVESRHEQELDSDFTTTETKDGKYKISLYDTTEAGNTFNKYFAENGRYK